MVNARPKCGSTSRCAAWASPNLSFMKLLLSWLRACARTVPMRDGACNCLESAPVRGLRPRTHPTGVLGFLLGLRTTGVVLTVDAKPRSFTGCLRRFVNALLVLRRAPEVDGNPPD